MNEILYDIYTKCFTEYPTSKEIFEDILQPESAHVIYADYKEKTIGFSLIWGNSVSLLCVEPEYRTRGYGSYLLSESEKYILESGAKTILLGRGSRYLLQGVPHDSCSPVAFFAQRGYRALGVSVNMTLPLAAFNPDQLNLPAKPKHTIFRFASQADIEPLLAAVADAQPSWQSIFAACADPIVLALYRGRVVGFEIVSPHGACFDSPIPKAGSIGCVGVIPQARNLGIGRQMVAFGAEWLKNQGCPAVELRYVHLSDWYKKIGFVVTRHQWMGEKRVCL